MNSGHLQGRLGCVTCYSLEHDPRFAYYVYIPRSFGTPNQRPRYPLIALVHGTERSAEGYRNNFKALAEETGSAILAPLFPAGVVHFGDLDSYNMIRYHDIDFSNIFLHMLEELAKRFPVDTGRICLHGFSAGGQFVHRFFYLYPERLRCVSIGSCGNITYPDPDAQWPDGVKDLHAVFGRPWNPEAMRQVAAQIVIGGEDTKPPMSDPGGPGRMELNRRLFEDLKAMEIDIRMDVIKGAGHNGFKILDPVYSFFRENLPGDRTP